MDVRRLLEMFELGPDAGIEDVKRAYRDMASVWHPDRFLHMPRLQEKAEKKLKEYNQAYEKLLAYMSSKQSALIGRSDQAEFLFKNKRIITISSGKGGVGKTNFTINAAIALQRLKKSVMILDADLGMANVDVLCGLTPEANLGDVINGGKSLDEVIVSVFGGIRIIPGVSGVENLTALNADQQQLFFEELSRYEIEDETDIILIDIGAGMAPTIINFMMAASENIIIITPEPTSLMDAYALIKTVVNKSPSAYINVVSNMVKTREEGYQTFDSLNRITKRFLDFEMHYIGHILSDEAVSLAVKRQKPYIIAYPNSRPADCIRAIADTIVNGKAAQQPVRGGIRNFFKRMSSFVSGRKTFDI